MQNHCTHNTSISSLIAIAHPDEATEVIKSGGRSDRNTNVRDTSITYPSRAAADYIRFHIISISSQRRIPMVVHSISLGIQTRHQVAAPSPGSQGIRKRSQPPACQHLLLPVQHQRFSHQQDTIARHQISYL